MAIITGVRFKDTGKTYYFDPGDLTPHKGDLVIVETARGLECGEVSIERRTVTEEEVVSPLKRVLRIATEEDIQKAAENREKERWAMRVCEEKIVAHKLDMHLVEADYAFDGTKVVFYFTSDGRVDFRALVRDLASVFKTRIELRQIGVRDEVKLIGGLGACGRETCCRSFLADFAPVSIRMAKDQNLSLNPTKISGICGRLMCCLGYEEPFYQATLKRCPKRGAAVKTPAGMGFVYEVDVLREKVKVRLQNSTNDTTEVKEFFIDELGENPTMVVNRTATDANAENEDMPEVRLITGEKAYIDKPKPANKPQQKTAGADVRTNTERREGANRGGRRNNGQVQNHSGNTQDGNRQNHSVTAAPNKDGGNNNARRARQKPQQRRTDAQTAPAVQDNKTKPQAENAPQHIAPAPGAAAPQSNSALPSRNQRGYGGNRRGGKRFGGTRQKPSATPREKPTVQNGFPDE